MGVVEDKEAAEAVPDVAALRLNNGQRVDYALQELVSEQINEYVSSIAAHSCYFASPDVAYFVTKLVYDQPAKATAGDTEGTGMMDDGQEVMASDKAQEEAALAFSYEKIGKGERTFVI
jgi:carbamoylphosphate synthase large subunit